MHYYTTYLAYVSKVDPDLSFATQGAAFDHDKRRAAEVIADLDVVRDLQELFDDPDPIEYPNLSAILRALQFAVDHLKDAELDRRLKQFEEEIPPPAPEKPPSSPARELEGVT